jgi:predicted lipoprotein with Yx(FWY)xxD motif
MTIGSSITRRALVTVAIAGGLVVGLSGVARASTLHAAPSSVPGTTSAATVTALSTPAYGSVLEVGGSGPLAGAPLYLISSDADGTFGCTTTLESTFQGPITCTGPESDALNQVQSDEWPAFTTAGAAIAGPGVDRHLLGSVHRPGIGRQVTYAGHPLYLFDPPSTPFVPFGEGFLESVQPLPPWHGLWDLVNADEGQPAPGVATIETETLPNGRTAVAAETYPNAVPGGAAATAYSFSRDHEGDSDCVGSCAVRWIPVLTMGKPHFAGGVDADDLGTIRRSDGTEQVTYHGAPLYLYSSEQFIFPSPAGPPQTTGTAGNGNGLSGPDGGRFSTILPD